MKIVAKFTNTEGQTLIVTFDRSNNSFSDNMGRSGTYKTDPATNTIAITGAENITFTLVDAIDFKPGFTTKYTASNGKSGAATIESVS